LHHLLDSHEDRLHGGNRVLYILFLQPLRNDKFQILQLAFGDNVVEFVGIGRSRIIGHVM